MPNPHADTLLARSTAPLEAPRPPASRLARLFGRARPASNEQFLAQARQELSAALADLPQANAQGLRQLLESSASLRELWHLRPEVFRSLALHHSQAEAERRLAPLGRWFDAGAAVQRPR